MKNRLSLPNFLIASALLIGVLLAWPSNLQPINNLSPLPAFAGVGVANDESQTLFTASEDGKTIYMWQYYSSKPPKYIGKSEAILKVPAKSK